MNVMSVSIVNSWRHE